MNVVQKAKYAVTVNVKLLFSDYIAMFYMLYFKF
jgi:hypothetical protein